MGILLPPPLPLSPSFSLPFLRSRWVVGGVGVGGVGWPWETGGRHVFPFPCQPLCPSQVEVVVVGAGGGWVGWGGLPTFPTTQTGHCLWTGLWDRDWLGHLPHLHLHTCLTPATCLPAPCIEPAYKPYHYHHHLHAFPPPACLHAVRDLPTCLPCHVFSHHLLSLPPPPSHHCTPFIPILFSSPTPTTPPACTIHTTCHTCTPASLPHCTPPFSPALPVTAPHFSPAAPCTMGHGKQAVRGIHAE